VGQHVKVQNRKQLKALSRVNPAILCSSWFLRIHHTKADPTVLLQCVNDYRQLNTNTVTDSFPIPYVSEILADIVQGTYFAMIDMTNSFFQTRMHDDDVGLNCGKHTMGTL
jgi:hypothetical protein